MAPRPPIDQLALAERLARLVLAADLEGIDPAPLLRAAASLGPDPGTELHVGVDHEFSTLALQAHWPAGAAAIGRFLEVHRDAHPAQHTRLGEVRSRPGRIHLVEWRTVRGHDRLACLMSSVGPRPLAEDVDRAASVAALGDDARRTLAAVTGQLARGRSVCDAYSDLAHPDGDRVELRFVCANRGDQASADTIRSLGEAGAALGIAAAQLRFIDQVHAILTHGRPSLAAVAAGGGALAAELCIEYGELPWETALRVVHGMYPDRQAGRRLGNLAGAAGGDRAMLRLTFGGGGLPAAQVWTALAASPSGRELRDIPVA